MSKKRAKSGGSAGVSRWDSGIVQAPFEEENWKASIAFIVGKRLEDYEYTQFLCSAVHSGLRKLFSVISKGLLFQEVQELGNAKVKKPKDAAAFSEICEAVKPHLDNNEDVPLPLLAKLLKWKLLAIKQKDMKRRDDDKKSTDGKDGKDKKGGKDKRARSKSPAKGKGKNKSPEIPSPKKESKLKKRGEEEDDNKYIDDEPDDGPQHYVIIEGFDLAPLLALLSDLGVNVDSIIKVGSEDYQRFERRKAQEEEEEEERPPEVLEAEKLKREKAVQRLETFWNQHEPLLRSAPRDSKLHDLARLTYTVKEKIIPDDMEDNELRTEFGTALFEDIACMMYDLLDSKRQFLNYMDNMKLIQIPSASGPAMPPAMSEVQSGASLTTSGAGALAAGAPADAQGLGVAAEQKLLPPEVDMRYYTELMDSVPHESVSMPIIMHCMLEQITATEEDMLPPSEKAQTPRDDGLDPSLAAHIEGMTSKLHMSAKEKEDLENSLNSRSSKSSPATINGVNNTPYFYRCGDDIARRLHHLRPLNGFNPSEAELAMMDYIPVAKLREFPRPCQAVLKQRAARLQELLQHCASGAVDQAEVDHAFRQFVFESLKLRGTDADGQILASETKDTKVIWDDPYPLFVSRGEDDTKLEQPFEIAVPAAVADANQVSSDEPSSKPGSAKSTHSDQTGTGILKNEPAGPKSRQGSASSARSARSTVHFEKDASGNPILPAVKDPQQSSSQPPSENSLSLELPGAPKGQRSRPGSASSAIGVQDIGEKPERNLDEWRYAEYLEPSVLLQVLQDAREVYPYMDTYYHKRDHSLLVVMHNPVGPDLKNHEPWSAKLHSNVGFRNYMEHVADHIKDWTAEEEEKYQAEVRRKEEEAMRAAASTPSPSVSRPSSGKSRVRSGSPKKSRSKSPKGKRSVSPTHSVDNLDPNSSSFMRPNSMKAWKVEQDKIREEEEKKRTEKEKKGRPRSRSRSGSPKKEDKEKKDDKKDKRAASPSKESGRNSKKGTKGDKGGAGGAGEEGEKADEGVTEEPKEPEREYPFVGYNVGNDLIHASGFVTTLFPCDGGQIRTEKTEFIDGPSFVKTSVLKDGHVFVIHLLNPRPISEDELTAKTSPEEGVVEKAEHETQEKDEAPVAKEASLLQDLMDEDGADSLASEAISVKSGSISGSQYADSRDGDSPTKGVGQMQRDAPLDDSKAPEPAEEKPKPISSFGSFTATLSDGMVFALSNYGSKGTPFGAEPKQEVEIYVPPPTSPSPPPTISSPKGTRAGSGKKGKKQQQQQQQEAEKQAQLQLEQQQREEEERKRAMEQAMKKSKEPEEPPFQQLFVSCPDGLHVNYLLEKDAGVVMSDPGSAGLLLVRQSYPYKTSGKQECESARQVPAMQEKSRLITSDGSVIKMMKDGTVQVLFADGAVSISQGPSSGQSFSPAHSRDPSPQRGGSAISTQVSEAATKKGSVRGAPSKSGTAMGGEKPEDLQDVSATEDPGVISEWVTTAKDGVRIGTRADGSMYELKACMMYSATDPMTYEVMNTREDRVVILLRPDGSRIVDHNEGTRITTYYNRVELAADHEEHAETGEEPTPRFKLVRHYKVECPGYATVIFNSEDSLATTIFGSGTEIISIPNGSYEVLHQEGGRVTVKSDGMVEYIPGVEGREPKTYVMRHQNPIVFETDDPVGNRFTVRSTGETEVKKASTCDEDKVEMGVVQECHQHLPRFFVINEDGSGVELLRGEDIEGYLERANLDPNTAILWDPLADHPDVNGITVMRPYTTSPSKVWLMSLDEPNIVPPNLRSRDFAKFPARELKHPGPKFGTNVGKGLAVGSRTSKPRALPIPKCPSELEIRQFVEYKPISEELRQKMRAGLEAYANEMQIKDQQWAEQELKEPRDEAERVKAGELLASILAQDERDLVAQTDAATDTVPQEVTKTAASATKPRAVTSSDEAKALYEKATAPAPLPPQPKPKNKYVQEDWDKVRRDLAEEQNLRKALRNHEVPPYFQSEWGESFLVTQAAAAGSKGPDMDGLTKDLAEATRQGDGQGTSFSLPSTPSESPASQQQAAPDSSRQSEPSESASPQKQPSPVNPTINVPITSSSPADVRPTNPTPAHAGGQGTPTPLRPNNPTPAHASQQQGPTARPGNPTPGGSNDNNANSQNAMLPSETPSSYASFPNHPSTIPEHAEEGAYTDRSGYTDRNSVNQQEGRRSSSQANGDGMAGADGDDGIPSANSDLILTKSLLVDVNGEPRKESVRLPAAILGQKPGMVPNEHFQVLEDPVRRKVYTSSIAGAEAKGIAPLSKMRGFEVVPGEVHFGTLREGCTYAFSVNLKNCGIDTCRYKVKQPPPATGLQVVYTPGPVSAGMKAVLELQLYAIAVGVTGDSGQGSIGHHVEIITEMEQLFLPVTANILTAHEYDERCRTQGTPRVAAGVRMISARPPSREGIIRPRKTQQPGATLEADSQLVQ
ncbi:sperm-associated antigen 17-like isoform X2 [Patiria miniata]|uniref:Sperm-associated antigen 17 n=1 Tax=Patiria miniata TaxID=46514 RepID=A0A914BU53_PATMI|nr:sperm-associated antigen 17-like isoform X2 [Patiria miniata]